MKALTYHLRLLEPVLVAQAQSGEENSAIGLPFIPGSAIRGALVARYLEGNPLPNLATDPQARRLFLDGTVCFLNAYPMRDEERLLPKPASWFTEKELVEDDAAPFLDGAMTTIQSLENPKAPAGEFCYLSGASAALYMPPRQMNVHIALIDANVRDERNKVYRYDTLAEGEIMAGAVLAPDGADLKEIEGLLSPGEIQIGGAHTAGYGRVRIEAVDKPAFWEEYTPGADPGDGTVVVTLLSDAILRGQNGQVDGDLNALLAARLGHPDLVPRCYRRLRLVGGFNRKWSLPLAQTWALQAGSVYVYPPQAKLDPDALRRLVGEGIGERRAEGFGRVAVNWHTEPDLTRYKSQQVYPAPQPLSVESKKLARQMAQRRLRLLLDRRLAEAVNGVRLANPPKNAQLSRVRNTVQGALAQGDLKPVLDHLDNLKAAKEQFEKARVNKTVMLKWIQERVRGRDVKQQLLRSDALPSIAGEGAELTEALRILYTGRLIDGVMKKAIKQNQEVIP